MVSVDRTAQIRYLTEQFSIELPQLDGLILTREVHDKVDAFISSRDPYQFYSIFNDENIRMTFEQREESILKSIIGALTQLVITIISEPRIT